MCIYNTVVPKALHNIISFITLHINQSIYTSLWKKQSSLNSYKLIINFYFPFNRKTILLDDDEIKADKNKKIKS
jgi:hypothetical protein